MLRPKRSPLTMLPDVLATIPAQQLPTVGPLQNYWDVRPEAE